MSGRSDPIVVGVSPASGSPAALRWAAEEAALHNAPLRAVLAWRPARPPAAPGGRPPAVSAQPGGASAETTATEQLRDFVQVALGPSGRADGVECVAVRGSAVSTLLSAAGDAQLLVIGESRPGAVGSVRTSLVAPQVVRRARCPVVVLPAAAAASP